MEKLRDLYIKRPFKTRNADEYNLSDILSLFVNPIAGLKTPVDFENSIIKGRMGSGKTMFLRANYAYYLFNMVPRLIEREELILPVFIKLNDLQHINEPQEIYRQLIIKIAEEISSIYLKLQDEKQMAHIQYGMKKLPSDIQFDSKIRQSANRLLKMGSEEYVQQLNQEFGLQAKVKHTFFEASANYKESSMLELKQKSNPGIKDIVEMYDLLLKDSNGKIVLLIDEAGSLDKEFFKSEQNDSFFEIFMNQIRTTDFIRSKIAVYPNSYSDILTETRYGDIVSLEEDISSSETYSQYRKKVEQIIFNYINYDFYGENEDDKSTPNELFEISSDSLGDGLEQIINASGGNYRRLIQLLDLAMDEAFKSNRGEDKIKLQDAEKALTQHCQGILDQYSVLEKEFIHNLAKVCKARSTYRFRFPNNGQALFKYISKSQEYNLINIIEAGAGRKGTTYSFDYSYCIHQDLATHLLKGTEKIDKTRSYKTGDWVKRNVTIDEELIKHAEVAGKINGQFDWINKGAGFIKSEDGVQYFFNSDYFIESDKGRVFTHGTKVLFYPWKRDDLLLATEIEIL
jgi:hypothetical protein